MAGSSKNKRLSWLDDALRDVPLPAGLKARLARLGVDSNAGLDEALVRVAVPQGLIERLKRIPEDVELDHRLRGVAVPAGLSRRLKQIAGDRVKAGVQGPQPGDASLDAALQTEIEVEIEAELEADVDGGRRPQGRRAASVRRRWARRVVSRPVWMVAASLLAVIALGAVGYFTSGQFATDRAGRDEPLGQRALSLEILADSAAPSDFPLGAEVHALASRGDAQPEPPDVVAGRVRTQPSAVLEQTASVWDDGGPLSDPLLDAGVYALEQLAMPESLPVPPPLGMVALDEARGAAPPADVGFDWTALLRDGVNPFVSPADHPQLDTVQVPLWTSTASYDAFRRLVAESELPVAQQIRTEDFLAAVDYGYPLPEEGALALFAAGGPSPWDPLRKKLLLLGVQARGHQPTVRPPADLTVVVDLSMDPAGVNGLAACDEAIGRALEAFQEGDRVSVVLAAQRPILLAQQVGPQAAGELLAALEGVAKLGPQPMADVVPAIETALRQSSQDGASARRHVVCITSDLAQVAGSEKEQLMELVAAAAREGVRFDVVRMAPLGRPDETSVSLSQAGGGKVHAAGGADDLWASLHGLVTMQPAVAARGASLTVHFDPQSVASYRILGHEARPLEPAGEPGPLVVDLLLNDTSVVMFEVELHSSAGTDVATARLQWQDPQSGQVEERVQRVGAAQFAATLSEAALPLQRGAVAAVAAEVLRRVPYAPPDADLEVVLEHADAVDSRIWDEAWFVDFLESIMVAHSLEAGVKSRGLSRFYGL